MTDERETPEPHSVPGGLDGRADIETGEVDGPDILYGVAEDEPALDDVELKETPFRTPHAGDRLTAEELESDID